MSKEITRKYFDYNALADKPTRAFLRKKAEHGKAILKRTAQGVWEMGQLLSEVKEHLPHGAFQNWIDAEFGLSYQSARRFMNVFEHFPELPQKLQNVNFSPAPSVLYMLAETSVEDETREVAMELAASGDLRSTADARAVIDAGKPPQPDVPQQSTPTAPDDDADSVFDDEDDEDLNPSNSTGLESETESDAEYSGEVDGYGRPIAQSTPIAASDGDDEPTLESRVRNAEVVHDTLSGKPKEEELSDAEWLETLPIWRVLKNKGHRGIILKEDLLGMRALWKAKETFEHHARRAFNFKASRNTPAQKAVIGLAALPHPRDWQVCAPCRGNGCARCDHSGYDTSGAGISPLRAERGEVAL